MTASRLLITGGSGLLALNWACAMRGRAEVVLAPHHRHVVLRGARSEALDLDDPHALARAVARIAPALVVHTAGLTSVDACERDPVAARHANVTIAANVAAAAAACGARLVHISTDHLFAGTQALCAEDEPPAPLNVYAQTKLEAEQEVLRLAPDALVVRTNFFGWGHRYRQSFSDWIIASLEAGRPLTLFDDVWFTPTLCDVVATAVTDLLAAGARGVCNVVGDERVSKFGFAQKLAQAFDLPGQLIVRGKLATALLAAPRPRDMSLDNARTRATLGRSLGTVDDALIALRAQDRGGRRAELLAAVTAAVTA